MSDLSSQEVRAAADTPAAEGAQSDSARTTWLADTFEREVDEGRSFLWLPVLFGVGILIYFALLGEPSTLAVVGVVLLVGTVAAASRRHLGAFRLSIAVTIVATGALTMKLHTEMNAAPKLPREMTAEVSGWVAKRETATRGGVRVVLRVAGIERLNAAETPYAVRVTVRGRGHPIAVGDAIAVTARLRPPNGPVLPGGYDFARAAYYDRIGGVGFAYGSARPADLGPAPLDIRIARPLERLRQAIGERIVAVLPGDRGRMATALITGDRGGISEATQEAMRASGLGHILAISGLHMALIAGSAFWLIRAVLALSAGLALRYPIKKWAALGAMLVASVYLGISGAHVATQRAYIMLVIMLLAVLLDRRAITLRNVALAAIAILVISPESILTASFQMSFAATIALVAAYEELTAWSDRRPRLADRGVNRISGKAWRYASGLFLTSLIAGLATTPFAIYHFQRMAPLTLLANLLAMPVLGIIVMPMAFLAVVVMPLGLEWGPLTVMSWGLGWIIGVAEWTSDLTGAAGGVRAMPSLALGLLVVGFLWLALWRRSWRIVGLVPLALVIPVAATTPRPDILVSPTASAAAVRGENGLLSVVAGPGSRFAVENWLRADADPRPSNSPDLSDGIACDPIGCVASIDGGTISVVLRTEAFAEDCHLADIVVSRFSAPTACNDGAIVIDRDELALRGAHALYRIDDGGRGQPGFRVATAYPEVLRPWMPGFSSGE